MAAIKHKGKYPLMEKKLRDWLKNQSHQRSPSRQQIKEMAIFYCRSMYRDSEFKASNKWLRAFFQRSESNSANEKPTEESVTNGHQSNDEREVNADVGRSNATEPQIGDRSTGVNGSLNAINASWEQVSQVNQGNGMGCASFNDGYVPAGGYSYNTPAERDGKSTVPSPPDALWQQENGLAQSAYSNSVDDGDMPVGSDLNGLNAMSVPSPPSSPFLQSLWDELWPLQNQNYLQQQSQVDHNNNGYGMQDENISNNSMCVPSPIVQPFVHPQPAMTTPWPSQDVNYTQGDCLNGYRNNGIIGCGMPIRSISTYNQMTVQSPYVQPYVQPSINAFGYNYYEVAVPSSGTYTQSFVQSSSSNPWPLRGNSPAAYNNADGHGLSWSSYRPMPVPHSNVSCRSEYQPQCQLQSVPPEYAPWPLQPSNERRSYESGQMALAVAVAPCAILK